MVREKIYLKCDHSDMRRVIKISMKYRSENKKSGSLMADPFLYEANNNFFET